MKNTGIKHERLANYRIPFWACYWELSFKNHNSDCLTSLFHIFALHMVSGLGVYKIWIPVKNAKVAGYNTVLFTRRLPVKVPWIVEPWARPLTLIALETGWPHLLNMWKKVHPRREEQLRVSYWCSSLHPQAWYCDSSQFTGCADTTMSHTYALRAAFLKLPEEIAGWQAGVSTATSEGRSAKVAADLWFDWLC